MTRLTVAACLAASLISPAAFAQQSQAEIAKALNEEGKTLLFQNKYKEATVKFRAAVARVPEPGYFVNLCVSLFHSGNFGEALTACNAVGNNNPSTEQRAKADKLIGLINVEAKNQKIDATPVGGGKSPTAEPVDCATTPNDPTCQGETPLDLCQVNPGDPSCQKVAEPAPDPVKNPPDGPSGGPTHTPPPPRVAYAVGRPPTGTGVFESTRPDNKYTWTLGAELFAGGAQVGVEDAYGAAAAGLRIKGDYMLNPRARLGAQGYLQITHLGQGEMQTSDVGTLDIFDLGIAGYKHLCPPGLPRLCLTPLVGGHIAMMSPNGDNDGAGTQVFNYAAVGARFELGAQIAFGRRNEHVLGVMAGLNLYSKVLSGPGPESDSPPIEAVGLDQGGATAYIGLGYTYRFRTPLGAGPIILLE